MAYRRKKGLQIDIGVNDNASKALSTIQNSLSKVEVLLKHIHSMLINIAGINIGAKLAKDGTFDKRTKEYKKLQGMIGNSYEENSKKLTELVDKEVKGKKKVAEATGDIGKKQITINQSLSTGISRVKDWYHNVKRVLLSMYVVRKLIGLFSTVVKESSQWVENLNLFETAFGGYTSEALEYLTDFAEKMGLSNNQIVKVTANFQELANTVGLVEDVSRRASISLTKLGYDIASLRNLDFDTIFEKLQSVIYGGQVKTARTLGINVSAEGLEELAREITGVSVSFRNLSENQKVLLRTIATFRQLGGEGADTFGDLGDTITSLENRIRVFNGSLSNLKQAIGDTFGDLLSDLVATGSAIIQAITKIIRAFKPLQKESGFNNTAEGIQNVSDATGELEEHLGLLDLDKFSVMGTGGKQENQALTELFNKAVVEQLDLYDSATQSVSKFDTKVVELRNNIIKAIYPLSEVNEETGDIIINTEKMSDLAYKIYSFFVNLKNATSGLIDTFLRLAPAIGVVLNVLARIISDVVDFLDALGGLEIILGMLISKKYMAYMISLFKQLYKSIGNATNALSLLIKKLLSSKNPLEAFQKMQSFDKLLSSTSVTLMAITALSAGIGLLIQNWGNLSKQARVWIPILSTLAGVISAMAIAKAGLSFRSAITAGAIVAGISMVGGTLASIQKFEDGGLPKQGSLFFAGEGKGAELLGNVGGRTNVINEGQLGQVLYNSYKRANAENRNNIENGKSQVVLNVNGRELAKTIFNDINYVGKTNTGKSWGNN